MKEKIKYKYGGFCYDCNYRIKFWFTLNDSIDITYQNILIKMKHTQ